MFVRFQYPYIVTKISFEDVNMNEPENFRKSLRKDIYPNFLLFKNRNELQALKLYLQTVLKIILMIIFKFMVLMMKILIYIYNINCMKNKIILILKN